MYFDWDDANILHLARHDITPEEAERVIKNHPVDLIVQHVNGEWRLNKPVRRTQDESSLSSLRNVIIKVASLAVGTHRNAKRKFILNTG
jgi:hypothetical protein